MGKCMLKACTITHNGTCQIGQIALMEKGKRQRSKLFCKCNASFFTFLISANIGFGILEIMEDKNNENDRKRIFNEFVKYS